MFGFGERKKLGYPKFGITAENIILESNLRVIDGTPDNKDNKICRLIVHTDGMVLVTPYAVWQLHKSQLKAVKATTKAEVIYHRKSTVKRAIVGGILFSGLGAIIGAIDSLNPSEEHTLNNFLAIVYESKDGVENTILLKEIRGGRSELVKVQLASQKLYDSGYPSELQIIEL